MEHKDLAIQEIEDLVWRHNINFLATFASYDTVEMTSLTFNSTHAKFLCKKLDGTFQSDQTTIALLFRWMAKFERITY